MKIVFQGDISTEADHPISIFDAAIQADSELVKGALCATVNGTVLDMTYLLTEDANITLHTFAEKEGKAAYWHTSSHVMAQAVLRLYPGAKLAIGPSIDNGFYYDIDLDTQLTPEDLPKIEAEMKKIIKENLKLERYTLPRQEAISLMREKNQPYKVELIEDLPEDAALSFYEQGEFVDLCAGPHIFSTGRIKAFKLTSVAGAYWRGSEKNKMLQRIYGISFPSKEELKVYLERLEEAKRRDHRKLGRELDLFDIYPEGPGFPFFLPKGMVLRNALEEFWRQVHKEAGYQEIKSPIILNQELWHRSGHWDHYKDNMYVTKIDEQDFAIKPMNCPGSMLTFRRKLHSYRDLPVRMAEMGLVHRHELSGTLHGLMRVRCFTQDDAHIFMTPDQIESELIDVITLIDEFYKVFGFSYKVELSTRPEDSMGTDEQWNVAIQALKDALSKVGKEYVVNEGDGAFYGPKIDFHLEDSLGRTWQCGTVQLDFQMPERFDLSYVGADNEKHRPVMIHRVAFGSVERFIGILTEHFAGAFPVWFSPVQVKILPISEKNFEYVGELKEQLEALDIRVETDLRNEKIGYKIREAQLEKVPYMLVVGDKEQENGEVAVRSHKAGDLGVSSIDVFITMLQDKINTKAID